MKSITIEKRVGVLGCPSNVTILFDERPKAVMKAEEKEITLAVGPTQISVQAEVEMGGRAYRSNAYFVLNGKCPKLYLTVSGSKLVLSVK